MSRSIHTTRRGIEEAKKADYADREVRAAEIAKLRKQLATKRRTKSKVDTERRRGDDEGLHSPIESIPIQVCDEGEFVHFPASADDLRAVMQTLPTGVVDGLTFITLCLGAEPQMEPHGERLCEPDPLVGRRGYEELPGIYLGEVKGIYHANSAKIELFAYVYDPGIADREIWELYLRLNMLSTFVHEVAHHYDFTRRVARGRWRGDHKSKVEIYAESVQHEWVQNCIVPYLEKTYAEQVNALDAWITHHGGISIPLVRLAGDPRATAKNGLINIQVTDFGIRSAFTTLAEDVAKGEDLLSTRLQFARGLHYDENYVEALQIIGGVLAEHRDNLEALTLKADIWSHQERNEEARDLAEYVVSQDQNFDDAWFILMLCYEALEDWEKLLHATTRELSKTKLSTVSRTQALLRRATARLGLSDLCGMEDDLAAVERIEWRAGRTPNWVMRAVTELRERAQCTA